MWRFAQRGVHGFPVHPVPVSRTMVLHMFAALARTWGRRSILVLYARYQTQQWQRDSRSVSQPQHMQPQHMPGVWWRRLDARGNRRNSRAVTKEND